MASSLPYLASYKNVSSLFDRIAAAKQPEAFSQTFLYNTLGLKSTPDRALIPLLRTLGFIDASGKPTASYGMLKNPAKSRSAIGEAIRRAYAPVFAANEDANKLSPEDLRGLVAQVAGSDQDMTKRIVGTLNALIKVADFNQSTGGGESQGDSVVKLPPVPHEQVGGGMPTSMNPAFHYNIQVHLPSNGSEETYLSIFNALRKAFQ